MSHVLAFVEHRPWPLPSGPWVLTFTWHDLLFAHWPVPAEALRPLMPASLALDTYDGQAWLGVVPFGMTGTRLRWLPAIPGLAAFPEINVRTYVTVGNKPGVYFFSLDAANRIAVAAARWSFHLPYFHARMSLGYDDDFVRYASCRLRPREEEARFEGRYRPIGDVFRAEPASLTHWFTERYCLYAVDAHQQVYRGEIHHPPWPLQPAEAEITINTMTAPLALPLPDAPPLLHFARRLHVLVWPPHRVAKEVSER